jgi:outer membrane autotransporter protein
MRSSRSWALLSVLFCAVQSTMNPALADCPFCEITAAQDASFALGDRFLRLTARQAQLGRHGVKDGGFAIPPERPQSEGGHDGMMGLLGISRPTGESGWSVWATGFGGVGFRGDSTVTNDVGHRIKIAGGAGGLDYRLSRNVLIGAAMGYGTSGYNVATRVSNSDGHSALFSLYGSWSANDLYVDAALSYAYTDTATMRVVTAPASERADGTISSQQLGARFEVGWRAMTIPASVTPFAAVSFQRQRQGAYTENSTVMASGAPGTLGLTVSGQAAWSARSEMGVQITPHFLIDAFARVSPRVRVAWAHEFSTERGITTNQGAVVGVRTGRDALLLSLGAHFLISERVLGYAQFDGEWSAGSHIYVGGGGLRISW